MRSIRPARSPTPPPASVNVSTSRQYTTASFHHRSLVGARYIRAPVPGSAIEDATVSRGHPRPRRNRLLPSRMVVGPVWLSGPFLGTETSVLPPPNFCKRHQRLYTAELEATESSSPLSSNREAVH